MKRLYFLFFLFLFAATLKAYPCDCNYMGSFIKVTSYTSLTALVKVKKYLSSRDIYNIKTPMSMEVEIIEVYRGVEVRKTVIVWGDNGALCRPYLSQFKEGKQYVMSFFTGTYGGSHAEEKASDYAIANCGAYWLPVDVEHSTVTGDIDSDNRTKSTTSLAKLALLVAGAKLF